MSPWEPKKTVAPLVDVPGSWLDSKVCTNYPSAPPIPEGNFMSVFPNYHHHQQQPQQQPPQSLESPGMVYSVNHLASVPGQPHHGPGESIKVAGLRSGYPTERIEAHKEISLAIQRSREKECNVCLEVVFDKDIPKERRFGILPKCSHCYCLGCIRMWRASRYNKTAKLCPVCRTRSPFFIPSDYWVEDIHEKRKLIKKYMGGMARIPCRHFAEGQGTCYFGVRCFYKHEPRHAYPPEYRPTWESAHPGIHEPWQGSLLGATHTWGSDSFPEVVAPERGWKPQRNSFHSGCEHPGTRTPTFPIIPH
uniref:RING-type E3 ubiquitin transferase n=1 Tax=Esox lucius TaxID=8010 RepID=A0AAY5JVU9_ESOLU